MFKGNSYLARLIRGIFRKEGDIRAKRKMMKENTRFYERTLFTAGCPCGTHYIQAVGHTKNVSRLKQHLEKVTDAKSR